MEQIISNVLFFVIGFTGLGFAFWLIRMQIKKGKCAGCSECENHIRCGNSVSHVSNNVSEYNKTMKKHKKTQ
jgi:hypothetical protein